MPAKTIKRTSKTKISKARPRTLRESAKPLSPQPKQQVSIAAAKGRPMLTWVGKRPLRQLSVFPAQHIETFDPAKDAEKRPGGLVYHGDNKEVLAYLLANGLRGKVNLEYIDPPFDSGADYIRQVQLRGVGGAAKLDGESYTLGEQIQYTDIWANDNYLQFMYERLLLLKELLAEDGSIYLHCDYRRSHQLRCLMDEVFGVDCFVNELVWQRSNPHNDTQRYGSIHDTLFLYAKSGSYVFNTQFTPPSQEYITSHFTLEDTNGRYTLMPLMAQGAGPARRFGDKLLEPPPGTHWRWTQERIDEAMRSGLIVFTTGGTPRYKFYVQESQGRPIQSVWTDVLPINSQSPERGDYPTQKPEQLLDRIVKISSNPNDLVLDIFIGSGTTVAVAQKLGRRWIACDINKGAIQTTSKRLQTIIQEQIKEEAERKAKPRLVEAETKDETPPPTQLSFATYRVNDYDLQIQHNEAVNLACERIGITRTKGDGFFDGELGKRLAKIIPFNHPLTPLDLEEIKRELSARPSEERDIVVVCLGKEFAVEGWLADWNRLRKGKEFPNKIEAIELRTDSKYGQFFEHKPASARVSIERKKDQLQIEIKNFISPSIVERLKQQSGVLAPRIDDWRAMVDCVMIDTAYNGEVFNIVHSDVPEKKSDLVEGKYSLPAPKGKTTVAVKIVDMLGEEVLVVEEV